MRTPRSTSPASTCGSRSTASARTSSPELPATPAARPRARWALALSVLLAVFALFLPTSSRAWNPGDPLFSIITNDGETVEVLDYVGVVPLDPDVFSLQITSNGVVLGDRAVGSSPLEEVEIDTSPLDNGEAVVSVVAFDASGALIESQELTLWVGHPTIDAEILPPVDNTPTLTVDLEGLAGDQTFIAYAAPELVTVYSDDYDVVAPVDIASSQALLAGSFPAGYGGAPVALQLELPATSDPLAFYLVVLTLNDSGWHASNAVFVSCPAPPSGK